MKKIEVNKRLLQKVTKAGTAFVLAGTMLLGSSTLMPHTVKAAYEEMNQMEVVNIVGQVGVNLYMDDKGFIPTDVNGNETYPFICDGTTYVPIRAIAELFNADVKWEESTNSVHITTTGDSAKLTHEPRVRNELYSTNITAYKGAKLYINGVDCIPTDINGNVKDIYIVNGTTYVPVRAISTFLGLPITWSDVTNSVFIGKHKTEGLTVENINDPVVFRENIDKFYTGYTGMWRYTKTGEDGKKEFLLSNTWPVSAQIVGLLNSEYCTNDLYKGVFETRKEEAFANTTYFYVSFFSEMYDISKNDKGNIFDWNLVIINHEYAEFLTKYQQLLYDCYLTGDYTELLSLTEEYYYGTKEGLHYGKSHPIIDYMVTHVVVQLSLNYPSVKQLGEYYEASQEKKSEIRILAEEMQKDIYSRQLTK